MKILHDPRAIITAICMLVFSADTPSAQAAPPDLTAKGVIATIDSNLNYNLGATGMRGWIFIRAGWESVATLGRS